MSTSHPPTTQGPRPQIKGVHHIKLPTSSLSRSKAFYTDVLGFTHLANLDHIHPETGLTYGLILQHTSTSTSTSTTSAVTTSNAPPTMEVENPPTTIELRYSPTHAFAQKGWDPLTFGVSTLSALKAWEGWLDAHAVPHSPVMESLQSWVLAAEDSDGRVVRFMVVDEGHAWNVRAMEGVSESVRGRWLGDTPGDPEYEP